jgi:hypothetical protein
MEPQTLCASASLRETFPSILSDLPPSLVRSRAVSLDYPSIADR